MQLVHQVLVLVADAVARYARREHVARGCEVRVHYVARAQVVGQYGRLVPMCVQAVRQREHARRLARSQKAAEYHVLRLCHFSFPPV